MKTKRVFFALLATLLLPLTAMAQIAPTPQPGTAVIAVSVFFNNGNVGDPVTVRLNCSTGTVTPTEVQVVNPQFGVYEHAFVVSEIPVAQGNGAVCTVEQDALAGYTTLYDCNWGGYYDLDGNSAAEDCDGDYQGDSFPTAENCLFEDVQIGDTNGCAIRNEVDPVEVEVVKEWDINGFGGDDYARRAEITIWCNGRIKYGHRWKGRFWRIRDTLRAKNGDYDNDEGEYIGVGSVTAWVYPWWYPIAQDPDEQEYTDCWAYEDEVDSAVEVESDCGSFQSPGMGVLVNMGDSCTITNTLFFEGIPTLNQYGMAIMALLMLGVGFVGFRRFV